MFRRDFWRDWYNGEYTLVPLLIKIPGFRGKRNIPWDYRGMSYIPGGARNLLPLAYERPVPDIRPKRSKTGKNREFLQKTVFLAIFYTTQTRTRPQNFGVFALPRTKIPYKNNREFFGPYQGIICEYQGI